MAQLQFHAPNDTFMIHFHEHYYWYITAPLYFLVPATIYHFSSMSGSKQSGWKNMDLLSEILSYALIGLIGSTALGLIDSLSDYPIKDAFQLLRINYSVLLGVGHFYGALLFSVIFMMIRLYMADNKEVYKRFLDLVAMLVCITTILGKIACFCSGHAGCYGVPTALPWGVRFVNESNDSLVACHPIQLYSALANMILLIALYSWRIKLKPGTGCLVFLISTALLNMALEFLMQQKIIVGYLNLAQLSYLLILLLSTITFTYLSQPKGIAPRAEKAN